MRRDTNTEHGFLKFNPASMYVSVGKKRVIRAKQIRKHRLS